MINRKVLKDQAKSFLRGNFFKALIVCIIAGLLVGGGNNSAGGTNSSGNRDQSLVDEYVDLPEVDPKLESGISKFSDSVIRDSQFRPFLIFTGISYSIGFFMIALIVFILSPAIQVGKARFFLRGLDGDSDIGVLFSSLNFEEGWAIFKVKFVEAIYLFLWTLLFVIPGIIKSYEYRMVDYILAEDPSLSPNEAISLSRQMMYGNKFDTFVLDLSFWGWNFLAAIIPLPFTTFLVMPYIEATNAALYKSLSQEGLNSYYGEYN